MASTAAARLGGRDEICAAGVRLVVEPVAAFELDPDLVEDAASEPPAGTDVAEDPTAMRELDTEGVENPADALEPGIVKCFC